MDQIIDITFYPHCDDGSCDLGSADYKCPNCGKQSSDYDDLWWDQHKPNGNIVKTKCEHCDSAFAFKKVDYDEYELLGDSLDTIAPDLDS